MQHDQKKMESYYRARANEYDNIYLKPERQKDLDKIRVWVTDKFARYKVLEIACGTGYWTQIMASVADRILAIDSSEEVLAIAKERVSSESVAFEVGDAYNLKSTGNLFNASFSGFWISHVLREDRRDFLKGLATELNDGAKIVFLDNTYVHGSSTPISDKDKEGNTYQTRLLNDGSKHKLLKNFPGESELLTCIEGLGCNPIFTQWEYYWAFEYESIKP